MGADARWLPESCEQGQDDGSGIAGLRGGSGAATGAHEKGGRGGGSCGGAIDEVLAAGCDTLVTADLKYNHFEEAKYRGLNLLDAGHFETENPVCAVLARILREALPELTVLRAQDHKDETQFL